MDNVLDVLSKFKDELANVISDYNGKLDDIKKEEDFIQILGSLVNYSRSDCLLLPFYDEKILSDVFERVFPLSSSEINKIKTAKYLIEASGSIDKENFLQYNKAIEDVKKINDKLSKYYDRLLSDTDLNRNKVMFTIKVHRFTKMFDKISDTGFNSLIDDVDLFEEAVNVCNLSIDEVNLLLNVAIKDNLKYLDNDGVLSVSVNSDIESMKEENAKIQNDIQDLSNLLGNE